MPIQPFVNLKEKKNTRVEWADIGLCQLKNGLNREKVSIIFKNFFTQRVTVKQAFN